MYTPPVFAEDDPAALFGLIRDCPLALLVAAAGDRLTASHLPMFADPEAGLLRAHMARANEQCGALHGQAVLVVFSGPQHYISPSWYPSKREHGKVVPTWNYAAVHVHGVARVFEGEDELRRHVTELTRRNEEAVGSHWEVSDAPDEFVRAMTKAIVGIEIAITRIEGKWKMSQNRPAADAAGVAEGLEALATDRSRAVAASVRQRNSRR